MKCLLQPRSFPDSPIGVRYTTSCAPAAVDHTVKATMNSPEQTLASGLSAEPLTARPAWTASRARATVRRCGLIAWVLLTTLAFGQQLAGLTVHVVQS